MTSTVLLLITVERRNSRLFPQIVLSSCHSFCLETDWAGVSHRAFTASVTLSFLPFFSLLFSLPPHQWHGQKAATRAVVQYGKEIRFLAGQSFPLNVNVFCSQWEWFLQTGPLLTLILPFQGPSIGLSAFLRNPRGSQMHTPFARRGQGSGGPHHSSVNISHSKGGPRTVAVLERVGPRDLVEDTKCQAGEQTVFKCFKM